MYDQTSGKEIRVLRGHTGSVPDIDWLGDDFLISIGEEDRNLRVWYARSGEPLAKRELTAPPTGLASHGDTVWVGCRDGTIQVFSCQVEPVD